MENEAPVVMFTNYKRTDGFEVSLTLRGSDLTAVATELDKAIKLIATKGGTPVSRQNGFPKKEKAPIEYIQGQVCPVDGGRLIKPPTGSKAPIKCENQKYDFQTKVTSGCSYKVWPNQAPAIPERQVGEDEYRG